MNAPTSPRIAARALRAPFDGWQAGVIAVDVIAAGVGDANALESRRRERLADLLASAQSDSPMYRRLLRGRDPDRVDLAALPIARKPRLMQHFDEWVADPGVTLQALQQWMRDPARIGEPFLGRYTVWESSGSSGQPGLFVQDAPAMAVYDALEALRRPVVRPLARWLDPWGWHERMAFVGATGGHFASTVTIERLRRLNPAAASRLESVSFLQPLPALVAQLEAIAPTILATYPSAAVLLAQEHEAGRLRIAPHEIWTGGEMLSPEMSAFVTRVFGCPVVDSYGASECLALASSCRLGALHLNADWVILEPVDAAGRAVPEGTSGATTLLTNLANHVQPIIRYDLGDRVAVGALRCACGSHLPVLHVQGRSDDTLRLVGRAGHAASLLPLAISTVLEDEAALFDFQLVQTRPDELTLSSACGRAALTRGRRVLLRYLEDQGVGGVRVHCTAQCGRRSASGKLQRIVGSAR